MLFMYLFVCVHWALLVALLRLFFFFYLRCRLSGKLRRRCRDFPYTTTYPTHTKPSPFPTSPTRVAHLLQLISPYGHHPKSIVYLRVLSWCGWITCVHHCKIVPVFHALRSLCVLPIHLFSFHPGNHWLSYFLHVYFFCSFTETETPLHEIFKKMYFIWNNYFLLYTFIVLTIIRIF